MNALSKAYCRVFQSCFKLMSGLLPWREPKILSGKDSFDKLADVLAQHKYDKVLMITDKTLSNLGLINPLRELLTARGVTVTLYDETIPNPTINNIEAALKLYKENGCQALIAFGGGSSMDCAKGVGARVVRPNKTIQKMRGTLKILRKLPLLVAIPTTSGTGSEATVAAVITNSDTHEKYPLNDTVLIPEYAILNPELTVGLPKHITSSTGVDALTHAVEAYIGRSTTQKTRAMSEEATKLIFENLKTAYDNPTDLVARNNMQHAAYCAGVAFTRSYVGYVHALAHALGGMYSTPHGLANAVLLPYFLEEYGDAISKPLAKLADVVGIGAPGDTEVEKGRKFTAAVKELNAYLNIPTKIEGIKDEDIPVMVQRALKEANPLYPVPVLYGAEKLTEMYKKVQIKD